MMAAGPSGLAWQGPGPLPPGSPTLLRPLKCAPAVAAGGGQKGLAGTGGPHLCLSGASPNSCSQGP